MKTAASFGTYTFIILLFIVTNVGGMLASALMELCVVRHHSVQRINFSDSLLLSTQNLLLVAGCACQGVVVTMFILLATRDGISSIRLCMRTSVLLLWGCLAVGFGATYVISNELPSLLDSYLGLMGIASEVGVVLLALIAIEIAGMGCYKNTLYDFVASGSILGCCIGSIRAYQVDTYFGTLSLQNSWIILGHVCMYMVFYTGTLSLASSLIARAYATRAVCHHLSAILLSVALAAVFGCFTVYPGYISGIIPNEVARYSVGGGTALVALSLALVAFRPFKIKRIYQVEVEKESESIKYAKSLMVPAENISSGSDSAGSSSHV